MTDDTCLSIVFSLRSSCGPTSRCRGPARPRPVPTSYLWAAMRAPCPRPPRASPPAPPRAVTSASREPQGLRGQSSSRTSPRRRRTRTSGPLRRRRTQQTMISRTALSRSASLSQSMLWAECKSCYNQGIHHPQMLRDWESFIGRLFGKCMLFAFVYFSVTRLHTQHIQLRTYTFTHIHKCAHRYGRTHVLMHTCSHSY